MSESSGVPPVSSLGGSGSPSVQANGPSATTKPPAAATKPVAEGNPAFRMMGLPRLRLPSRNWMIFLSLTGSLAAAITYDKWQTRRNREKWCRLVAHLADEPLPTNTMPRKLTIYLSAPPSDSLRSAREHFHEYIKPVLVAAAMDWDVVEGRKEGDVRYKTAERIRRRRRSAGEGTPTEVDVSDSAAAIEAMRQKTGTSDFDGVAGDLVIGRNTWKEYVRGLHEGWLGPVDAPPRVLAEEEEIPKADPVVVSTTPASELLSKQADQATPLSAEVVTPLSDLIDSTQETAASESAADSSDNENKPADEEEPKVKAEEKPKRRNPLPYIEPAEYEQAQLSRNTTEILGPSVGVRFPHILGFRNTPIRFYRFLTRRYLADDVGRQVASAVLASYRPYSTVTMQDSDSASSAERYGPEQAHVLDYEERNWWKTTYQPRKEHEESVWIEDMVFDERISSRMQAFQLTSEDERRAQQLGLQTKDDSEN